MCLALWVDEPEQAEHIPALSLLLLLSKVATEVVAVVAEVVAVAVVV
jgi:hypothetical protein